MRGHIRPYGVQRHGGSYGARHIRALSQSPPRRARRPAPIIVTVSGGVGILTTHHRGRKIRQDIEVGTPLARAEPTVREIHVGNTRPIENT